MMSGKSKGKTKQGKSLDFGKCGQPLHFETLLADLSARFIHLPVEQVDDAIVDAQRRICECIGLDVVVLWQWEVDARGLFTLTHHYRRREGPPLTRQLQAADAFPWGLREVQAGRSFLFASLDDVPEGAERDRESYRYFGVLNALVLPLSVGSGAPFGAITFHDMVAPRVWSDALVQRLELVARIFANAMARRRYEETLQDREERLALAADSAGAGLWSLDLASGCYWATAKAKEIFGFGLEETVTLDRVLGAAHPEDRALLRQVIDEVVATGQEGQVEYRVVWPDGSVRWLISRGRVRQVPGRPPLLMGVTTDITARNQAAASLMRAHHQNQLILGAAAEGILGLDLTGNHVFVNPAAAKMLGYAPEELLGRGGHGIWHHSRADGKAYPEDECPICATCRVGSERQVANEVFWRKDGTCLPVDYKCTPVQEDGRRIGVVVTFADVTERREKEKALRDSGARMAAALDVAELGFYEMLNGVRVTFLDRRARDIVGATEADEQAGRIMEFWMEHLHPEDVPGVMEVHRLMEEAGQDRMTADYRFLNPARGTIHIHHLAHVLERDAAGLAVRSIGVLQDVTERKQKEAELRTQQVHLASAIEAAGLGFYEMGDNGRTHVTDDHLRALIGIPKDEDEAGVRDFWLAHVHPEDLPRVLRESQKVLEGVVDRAVAEYRYRHPARGELWFHHLSRALGRDAAGHAVRTVGVIQDVTERKAVELEARRTQNELAHATRMSVLGELAASMAHELNQPLAAILSNAQAARRFLAAPDPDMQEIREILNDIVRDDKRAGDVIHHMRAMVQKKGSVAAEPLDFNKLVGDTAKLVHGELVGRNIGLELSLAPKLPTVLAGRVEMQQVLLNLMVNAMDAMRDQPADRCQLRIQTSAADGRVRVALRDHGHGISENAMADIFRPFFTTKTHGLGMGLSISRSMVETHGGKLWAENVADGGAIFWIEMPVGEEERGTGGEGKNRGERGEGRGGENSRGTRGTAEGRGHEPEDA